MKLFRFFTITTLVLLASQSICGFYLANNPEAAAAGSTDFHRILGIVALAFAAGAVVSVFRKIKKTA